METDRKVYDRQNRFFSEAYHSGKIGWPREGPTRLVSQIIESSIGSVPGTVLEIGSGEGRNLAPFLERGWDVVAMDFLVDPLRMARERISDGWGGRVFFVQGDLFHLPFHPASFDVVFDFGVYHHLRRPEREKYPSWVARLLKPGGLAGLGVFSDLFRHFPEEVRRRNFITHRGHHDVFFKEKDLPALMGRGFSLLSTGEERPGALDHYRLAVYRKNREEP